MIYMWITNCTMLDGIIFFATTFTQISHNICIWIISRKIHLMLHQVLKRNLHKFPMGFPIEWYCLNYQNL
jgi:hypothetical protein